MKPEHGDAAAGDVTHAVTGRRDRHHARSVSGPSWVLWLVPVAVFGVGIALSLFASLSARDQSRLDTQTRFDASAGNATLQFERRFAAYTGVLAGMRALFYTVPNVSREDFRRYTQALALKRGFPGFEVLNYAHYVAAESKESFEEAQRRDQPLTQSTRFAIHPSGARADYYPVTLTDPPAEHLALLGRDLGATPAARATLEASRDSGNISASVIRPQGPDGRVGLAIRLPIYRTGMPLDSVEQRRVAYLGTIGAGIWMDEMLAALPAVPDAVRLRLFEGGPEAAREPAAAAVMQPDHLLFDTNAPKSGPRGQTGQADDGNGLRSLQSFRYAGKLWVVEASAPIADQVGPLERMVPTLVLVGGGLISTLLAGVVFGLTGSQRRATVLAHDMTRSLRSSQQQLAAAQALAKQGSWVLDAQSGEIEYSDEARRIYGFAATAPEPTLERLLLLMPELQRSGLRDAVERARRTGAAVELEHLVHGAGGNDRWVHLNLQAASENGFSSVSATVRDETTRRKSALRLALAHDIARELAGDVEPENAVQHILSSVGLQLGWHAGLCWAVDDDAQVRCLGAWALDDDAPAQEFAAAMRGFSGPRQGGNLDAAWAAANPLWRVIPTVDVAGGWARDRTAGRCGLQAAVVVPVIAGKQLVALEFFSRVLLGVDREIEGFMRSIASQLTQYLLRKQAESALRHVASHDALTGLVNRALLQERLTHALRQATRQQNMVAVLFIDLDRFKHINDSLGHGAGDLLLRACAERLRDSVRDSDTVARFGGDEFVLVLEGLNSVADVMAPLTKVLSRFSMPFDVNGHELRTTASVGISMFPADGSDVESLLTHADAAMYRAKETGPGHHHFYSAQMNAQSQQRLALETALPQALEQGELFMVYQPKQALADGTITGVEALMRWRHPTLGLISPLQFIPIAEAIGLIDGLGHWALQVACGDARRWQDQGHPVQVSVNLSARQLDRPRLAEEVAQVLADARLDPGQLELEITESGVMRNPVQAAARLRELRELGVSLAIDDFGTGYSSFSYLRTFPLCTLKIDRSFIKDLPADEDAAALTAGIIALAHRLRMVVVAEGVETVEQRDYLQASGCDQIQGYLLSKPMLAQEMDGFLRTCVVPALASSALVT